MNIFVGNISFKTSERDLEALFASFGPVTKATIITERDTGRSRGFGFVEMDDECARNAIKDLNGQTYMERALNVSEARPKPSGGGRARDSYEGSASYRR